MAAAAAASLSLKLPDQLITRRFGASADIVQRQHGSAALHHCMTQRVTGAIEGRGLALIS